MTLTVPGTGEVVGFRGNFFDSSYLYRLSSIGVLSVYRI